MTYHEIRLVIKLGRYLIEGPNVICFSDSVLFVFNKFGLFHYRKQNITTLTNIKEMYDMVSKEHSNLKIMVLFRLIYNHK
jgi:hypothetical protein